MWNSRILLPFLIGRTRCGLQLNRLHPSELYLCRLRAGHPERRSSTGSPQHGWCSLAPACSSPAPLGCSTTASTSRSNPSPPSTRPHQPLFTTLALVLPSILPSMRSITPARVPSSSPTLNSPTTPIMLITSTTKLLTTVGPVLDTTPVLVSCTTGTRPALLSQRHLSSSLPDPAPMRNPPSCRSLQALPRRHLPCHPLIHRLIPPHVPPPAPLSSHLLLHPVVLTDPAHLLLPRKSS